MKQSEYFLENADNCAQLTERAKDQPTCHRYKRMEAAWRASAEEQDWLDGETPPVRTTHAKRRLCEPAIPNGHWRHKLNLNVVRSFFVAGFFCERFSLPKFAFLKPELFHPFHRAVIFLPDFLGAFSNSLFVWSRQSAITLFQFFRQGQDLLHRFPVAYPPGVAAILIRLLQKLVSFGTIRRLRR
jgi:hypothetical protein